MKEVESVIQLDERPEQPKEPQSKFNEYKYEASPIKNHQKPVQSTLQQNRRKLNNPTIIRRTVNNQNPMPENNYYSNEPRNNFQGLPNEINQEKQTYQPQSQNNIQERVSQHENFSNRNVRTTTQGRVTLPSRYETQPNQFQNQRNNEFQQNNEQYNRNNQDQQFYQKPKNNQNQQFYQKSNNNQDIANLDEFQPEVFNPPNYQENPKQTEHQEPIEMNQDISNISLPNVKSNITVYKKAEENEKQKKTAKLVKKEFVFKYNSDKNGFFYFLGTCGGRRDYINPFELGQIKVFFSSLAQGDYSNFVGRALTNCRTCNEENAFMGVDLGKDR